DEHRHDLPRYLVQIGREGDEIDVHREQDQLDRHQDDDDVLAVHEDAENTDGEQHGGHRQIVLERDVHQIRSSALTPWPLVTDLTSTALSRARFAWAARSWRRICGLWRSVRMMAPIIAISRTIPAAWKK